MKDMRDRLIDMLVSQEGIVKIRSPDEEPFILTSGRKSRLFFDVKEASLSPKINGLVKSLIMKKIADTRNRDFNKLGSIAIGSIPITSILSYATSIPQIIVRSERHKTGTESRIIGDCKDLDILLIDDVATSGGSAVNAVLEIRKAGGICNKCIVVVDRQEGAEELCKENGITLYSILKKSDFGVTV